MHNENNQLVLFHAGQTWSSGRNVRGGEERAIGFSIGNYFEGVKRLDVRLIKEDRGTRGNRRL